MRVPLLFFGLVYYAVRYFIGKLSGIFVAVESATVEAMSERVPEMGGLGTSPEALLASRSSRHLGTYHGVFGFTKPFMPRNIGELREDISDNQSISICFCVKTKNRFEIGY